MREAVDKLGLVNPGYPLFVYLPAWDAYAPLLVRARLNLGYETYNYGPLPDCGNISSGVISAGGIATNCTFSNSELQGEQATDMFYYTDPDRAIHAHIYISPLALRILNEIPLGNKVYSLYGLLTQDLTRDFGWYRGYKEMIFMPKFHVGWDFYNPTNMNLKTYAKFIYGEYLVEPLLDSEAITRVLTGKAPAHIITFGGMNKTREIEIAIKTWNTVLVPRPPVWAKEDEIRKIVSEVIKR